MASVQILSPQQLEQQLSLLRSLLAGLPNSIPASNEHYRLSSYLPSEEDINTYGEEGAVNHDLEVIFCPQSRQHGPIHLQERGEGLLAVSDVLRKYTAKFPDSVILQKWIFDLAEAAKREGAVSHIIYMF